MRSPILTSVAVLLALLSSAGSTVAQAGPAGRGRPPRVPGVSELSEAERAAIGEAVESRLQGYGDALRRRDLAWFSSFWADEPGFAFASDGRLTTDYDAAVTRVYAAILANLREVAEFTFFNGHTYVLGRDAAAHTTEFRWAMVHLKGDTARAHGSWTYVFRNFGGTWRVVQSAGTHIVDRPAATASSTPSPTATPASAGGVPAHEAYLQIPGGRIWYRQSGNGEGTPVILLHGGPAVPSFYMKPFEELGDGRVVVRYDQLGAGKSGRISDTTLLTIPHFVAELDSLRAYLGYDQVALLGLSWGATLALEYYRAHPEHVRAMVLGSALLSTPAWEASARRLLRTLPDSERRSVAAAERAGKFDSPGYRAAVKDYYARYLLRHASSVQADLDSLRSSIDPAIYNYMWGPSEFTATGILKQYDGTPFLGQIKVPVLYTVGEFDEAGKENVERFAALTPGSQFVVFEGAAHLTPWDAREQNVRAVREFLKRLDADGRRSPERDNFGGVRPPSRP